MALIRSPLYDSAVRPDPRRRQLARARDARGRARRAALHAARRGRVHRGRRRPSVRRLGAVLGAAALRPRRPGDARGDRARRSPRGTTFGAPTEGEVELAAEIVDAVPSIEMVRLVSSGTEATMSAVRLARAATRRDRLIKFAGNYHGHVDALLASAGSGLRRSASRPRRASRRASPRDTIVLPFNDVDAVAAAVAAYGEGLAAIIVEPVAGNMGVVPPAARIPRGAPDAVRRERRAARLRRGDDRLSRRPRRRAGALRRHARPHHPRQDRRRRPAAAAFGGRAELMERLAPVGDVYQAGTLSGNPLATAAGTSVLRRLRDPAVYEQLEQRGARLEAGLSPFGIVQRVGAMLTLFCRRPVRDYATPAAPTRSGTPRSSGTCSTGASIWRRPSSSACSSRSHTATRRSTGRSRPLATSTTAL